MAPRLPDPPCHAALLEAVARLAGAEAPGLLVAPERLAPAGWTGLPRIAPDEAPPAEGLALIAALDLWSEAADPAAALARLQAALAPGGRLLLVQTNWPQRRGTVPPEAGGPPRSPDFYGFRSEVLALWPEAVLGLATLDGRLALHPLPPPGARRPALASHDAIAFLAADSLAPATAPPPLPQRAAGLAEVSPAIARGARRSLAFVIDVPDWAYANIVDHIAPHLAGRYDISRFYVSDHEDRARLLSALFVENRFDHIHFMWRELWFNAIRSPSVLQKTRSQHGLSADEMAALLAAPVVTTTIYDHLFLTAPEIEERRTALALTDGYSTASELLGRAYRTHFDRGPDHETPDGVNSGFFARGPGTPDNPGRVPGRLRVGWVGNSAWGEGKPGVGDDPKGLHSILKPAIEALQAEGRDVVLELADRNLRRRDREEMRAYYAGEIDVLVCASAYEGTPNPVLEATASGRAWVSTDVGTVREVAGPVQTGLILAERSPQAMADALRRLLDDPGLLAAAEAENRARAAGIDWTTRVSGWTRLFAAAEARHEAGGALLRRELIATRLLVFDQFRDAQQAAGKTGDLLAAEAGIASLEAWLDSALTEIANRDTWIGQLQARIAELEGWGGTLQSRVAELEGWSGALQARITELDGWTAALQARNTDLETALGHPVAGLRRRLAPRRVLGRALRALRRRLGAGGKP